MSASPSGSVAVTAPPTGPPSGVFSATATVTLSPSSKDGSLLASASSSSGGSTDGPPEPWEARRGVARLPESGPSLARFTARTRNSYRRPLTRPSTVKLVVSEPPGTSVQAQMSDTCAEPAPITVVTPSTATAYPNQPPALPLDAVSLVCWAQTP